MADYRSYSPDRKRKRCARCEEMFQTESFRTKKHRGGAYLNSICRSCEQKGIEQYRTMTPTGVAAEIVRRTKYVASQLGIGHDLTVHGVLDRLDRQEWKCVLTGLPFVGFKKEGDKKRRGFNWNSISCDRIHPTGGYVMANIRFILNVVNLFKNDGPDERMFEIAEALLQRRTMEAT